MLRLKEFRDNRRGQKSGRRLQTKQFRECCFSHICDSSTHTRCRCITEGRQFVSSLELLVRPVRMSLLIKNGKITTATDQYVADILCEGETITAIGHNLS